MREPFNIDFRNWFNLSEVNFTGGKYDGQNHEQVPTGFLIWYIKKFQAGQLLYKFNLIEIKDILGEIMKRKTLGFARNMASIKSKDEQEFFQNIDDKQANDILAGIAHAKGVPPITLGEPSPVSAPAPISAPVSRPAPTPSAVPDRREWFLAKIIAPYAGLDIGTFVAVAKSIVDPNNFEYIKIDDPTISGILPLEQAKKHLESQRNDAGSIIKINKPETGKVDPTTARLISISGHKKAETKKDISDTEKKSKYILTNLDDPKNIEQKQIDKKFLSMLDSPEQSHLMINALAGSGKTTMLNHLAWKYGRPGQKWLYLVFNAKNRHEAKNKFPSWVQVETTNSFLQKELNNYANKKVFGGTTLITRVLGARDKYKKIDLLADTVDCANLMRTLNLPDPKLAEPRSMPRGTKEYKTSGYVHKYLTSIKLDAVKMVEIAKSYSLNPNDPDCENMLREIMVRNFWPHEKRTESLKSTLDKKEFYDYVVLPAIKESRATPITGNWEEHDKNATYTVAMWLFKNSLPGARLETIKIDGKEYNLGDLRDFADDLWFSSLFADKMVWSKFDVVMADEVQDFSANQKIMLRKLAEQGAKIIAVGDPSQCHPAGTMISLTGNVQKPIEEVKIGDIVMSHATNGKTKGRKVEEIACREYTGDLINISAGEFSHSCTPNHKCFVKLKTQDKHCLYMLQKEDGFKLGTCQIIIDNQFGIEKVSIEENANKSWLLDIFETAAQAKTHERFVSSNLNNAYKCLEQYGRSYDYPIWNSEDQNNVKIDDSFVTQACNLISDTFEVKVFDNNNTKDNWINAKITREKTKCKVYSLKVEPDQNGERLYVANNIVTHNSIYKFRGADHNSFNSVKDMLLDLSVNKDVEQILTRNFRSKKNVIDFVNSNTIVNNLKQGKQFAEGDDGEVTVAEHTEKKSVELIDLDIQTNKKDPSHKVPQTAYISRNGAPLAGVAVQLLRKSIPFIMFGKDTISDISRAIIKYVGSPENLKTTPSVELPRLISDYASKRSEKYSGKAAAVKSIKDEGELQTTINMTLTEFEKIPDYDKTAEGYLKWMKDRICPSVDVDNLSEEEKQKLDEQLEDNRFVVLTTAHRSKGFEFDRVFILNPGMLGAKPRKRDPEISNEAHDSDNIQEENIKYVAFTRAKDQLHLLKTEEEETEKDRKGRSDDDEEGATVDFD